MFDGLDLNSRGSWLEWVAPMLLNGILAWLHIFGAIGWMGIAMFFGMVLGPLLGKLTPATRSELILKLFPKVLVYIRAFSIFTVLMGVALVFSMTNGDLSLLSPATSFGLYITVGATLALITIAVAMGLVLPSAKKVVEITQSLVQNPGPPPPELLKVSRRLRIGSVVGLALLVLVLAFMVAAAWG